MKDFQFWFTLGTATIPAIITGLLSFLVSWLKNRTDLKSLEKQFQHDMDTLEKNHLNELEKMKEANQLELENIQKQSEIDITKEVFGMMMNAAAPALQDAIVEEVKKQRKQKR